MDGLNLDEQMKLEQYKAQIHAGRENFKAVIAMGQNAIKSALLVNAGAAVAVLAFMGKGGAFIFPGLYEALLRFSLGVFCSIVAGGTAYLSQTAFALFVDWREPAKNSFVGLAMQGLSCLLIAAAYLFFLWGIFLAYSIFRGA